MDALTSGLYAMPTLDEQQHQIKRLAEDRGEHDPAPDTQGYRREDQSP